MLSPLMNLVVLSVRTFASEAQISTLCSTNMMPCIDIHNEGVANALFRYTVTVMKHQACYGLQQVRDMQS
jgi:hypothetical protein